MITSETPYKLAEIIRETWPGLYRNPKVYCKGQKIFNVKENESTLKNNNF